ncbi:MAG: 50S ribosomal protein L6 [Gammaproteobacteria bacterium HGW-Gammaproteobacteria-1]|jgi:large subunit ribosomal protein L6|nr:MAG: 50S ribosomal protein L6 [Gammaproteobacteria bacterium HGW-Gammaproteobacteria-1]
MARILNPVSIPAGVQVAVDGQALNIKGAKGAVTHVVRGDVAIKLEANELFFSPQTQTPGNVAMVGTTRALISNIFRGLTQGFERKLELVGVGYRAQAQGKTLNLTLGFSHPVKYDAPEGITIETPSQTEILVKGTDKQKVGQVAADIRAYRPPEPYKGKGIKYAGEKIIRKEAKKK